LAELFRRRLENGSGDLLQRTLPVFDPHDFDSVRA
jgi:hypothetical protein